MKSIIAALLTMVISAPAMAADAYVRGSTKDAPTEATDATPFNWGGAYIGGSAGFGVGQNKNDVTLFDEKDKSENIPFLPSIDELSGAVYGIHGGVNMQRDHLVFGVEASLNGTEMTGDSTSPGLLGSVIHTETEIDWYATAVGRLGYAHGKTLFYGAGGLAFGDVCSKSSATLGVVVPGATIGLSDNCETHIGWTAGVGIEHALDAGWIARVQYEHVDLGEEKSSNAVSLGGEADSGISVSHGRDVTFDTIKLGFSRKF